MIVGNNLMANFNNVREIENKSRQIITGTVLRKLT